MTRARLTAICVMAGLAAGPGVAQAAVWQPRTAQAAGWAQTRSGDVRFSVRIGAQAWGAQQHRPAPAASLVKAMLLVGRLRQARDRPLTAADRRLLDPMVRRSDDVAATVVRDRLGHGALRRLSRTFGMRRFREHPVWGLSTTSPADQTRFFARIDRLLPVRHRAYGLRLLATVVPSQRWGIGRVPLPDFRLYFKGGWGSGSGAVEHQSALLVRGTRRVAVSVMVVGSPSHAYGKRTLEGVFKRLLRGVR